ncbi:MAG: sigma-70 family RNA polymerase sigma factor [Pirellulaceae bacterium]|nr:sigma-70 family RNA polymerase sigma factor [Pirellulaceae bacterium]
MSENDDADRRGDFESTRWSVVLRAGGSAPDSLEALETLCRTYWFSLYAYVRRRGYGTEDAQDLTQEFFARLLETGLVGSADPYRGKFRAFLLASLRNFLANHWEWLQAKKRGGGRHRLSLDFAAGDSRYALEPHHELTAERLFERQWAITLLDQVLARLRQEFAAAGRLPEFEQLKPFLAGRSAETSYAEVAAALGVSEGAAMAAGSRLRKKYRSLLREEVAQTLADPSDVDAELLELFAILAS